MKLTLSELEALAFFSLPVKDLEVDILSRFGVTSEPHWISCSIAQSTTGCARDRDPQLVVKQCTAVGGLRCEAVGTSDGLRVSLVKLLAIEIVPARQHIFESDGSLFLVRVRLNLCLFDRHEHSKQVVLAIFRNLVTVH